MGVSASALLGLLVDSLAAPGGAAAKVLEEIAKLLALPPGASLDEILKAVGALGDDLANNGAPADGAQADPHAANPDSPVPATANLAALSATDQKKWLADRASQRAKRRR
jgi:hypothetical protein